MNYLTADEGMLAQLRGIVEPVEIRDPDAKVLGRYVPAVSPEKAGAYQRLAELFDLEEAERVATTERGGYTIAEVKEYLRSLGKS